MTELMLMITRGKFLKSCLLGSTGLAAQRKRPNVLFLTVDDLRPELGIYGASHVRSPNLDALGRTGMVFTRAYCQQAVCNPSRASVLTGLRPDTLRVWDLKTGFRETKPDAITLPQHFRQSGYHTVNSGKLFHNVLPDPVSWSEPEMRIDGYPFDPDAVYRDADQVEWLEQRKTQIRKQGQEQQHIDRYGQWYLKSGAYEAPDVPDNAYYDGAQTDAAILKLSELKRRKQPFFFGVGYYRPHLPLNAPKKYWDLYDRKKLPLAANPFLPQNAPLMAGNMNRELRGYRDFSSAPRPDQGTLSEEQARLLRHGYFASVSYVDAQIGRLLGQLDRLRLAENTIVVLWGDHGWKLGEHNGWGKMTNYEVDTRVPLMIRAPGYRGGQRCDRIVECVDMYPTLCEAAGLKRAPELEGLSMVPLLLDPQSRFKTAAFSQFLREGIWVAPDGVEYMGYCIRTDRHRYVEWVKWKEKTLAARELYDLVEDPQENVNRIGVAGTEALVAQLAARLKRGWRGERP